MKKRGIDNFLYFSAVKSYFTNRVLHLAIYLFLILLLVQCREEKPAYLTNELAIKYFNSVEEICNKDNGQLWGRNLYGPIMYVDRETRRIVANYPDAQGNLKEENGVYTGTYPRELIIYSAPVKYGGTLYAMIPITPEQDDFIRKSWTVHILFHCLQQRLGIVATVFNQRYMDEKVARLYVKHEWKALKKAIRSNENDRLVAIRDALVFREAGRELYQSFAPQGNRFESYEGLATFTYLRLCSSSEAEYKTRLVEYLDRVYSMSSFARSYGAIHGALYADLLYDAGYDFRSLKTDSTDLANLVKEVYNVQLPDICRDVAGSLSFSYGHDLIEKEEELRLGRINERLHQLTSTFTEKPVVYLELESPYFDFEPEQIQPLDSLGTLYSTIRVSDRWGKLTVSKGGCLVSNNYKYLRITAKGFNSDKSRISGDGWNLILNEDWELTQVDNNYYLREKILM